MDFRISEIRNTTDFATKRHIDVECNSHINFSMEIVYVTHGSLEMTVSDTTYTIDKGDMLYVMPFEIHSFHTPVHSKCHVIMFSRYLVDEVYGAFASGINNRVCKLSPALYNYVENKLDKNENILDDLHAKSILLPFCAEIADKCAGGIEIKHENSLFLRILTLVNESFREVLSESELAQKLNVHPVTFSRVFSVNAGMSFNTYRNLLRTDYALKRLCNESEVSISEIAFDSGFDSIRTFNRVFSKHLEKTPLEYRKEYYKRTKHGLSYSPSPEIIVKN